MDLSNEKTFELFFLFCFFMSLIYGGLAMYVLNRKGVNIRSNTTIIVVTLTALPIGLLPFWLKTDLSWQFKVFVPFISGITGIVYVLVIANIRKTFKK